MSELEHRAGMEDYGKGLPHKYSIQKGQAMAAKDPNQLLKSVKLL